MYTQNTYHSLLTTLQKHRIPINYQCQSGYCGSCKILLISGTIKYYKKPLSNICSNEILSCCCHPITNLVLRI